MTLTLKKQHVSHCWDVYKGSHSLNKLGHDVSGIVCRISEWCIITRIIARLVHNEVSIGLLM